MAAMQIQTSRFGIVQCLEEDMILFPEGILGFADLRRFVLVDDPSDEIFAWLQSCEIPQIAFPVLEPELFTANYQLNLTKHDLESLDMKSSAGTRTFAIITVPEDPTQMTANVKAPIVINVAKRMARQIVLQDNNLAIREPIFAKLQSRVVQSPQLAIKTQASDWGVAVRLPSRSGEPEASI
jgi:flagellar assembly factor FliW